MKQPIKEVAVTASQTSQQINSSLNSVNTAKAKTEV
jgi:hypothetical protein